jgi:hypothetical protein
VGVVCDRVAASSTLAARLGACLAECVPQITGPPHREVKAHSLEAIPSRVFPSSRPSDPTVGPAPPRFLGPTTVSPALAPSEAGVTPPRFRSRVFSTPQRFASKHELRGLVSCRNRSWASSFRVFPSQESRAPLGAALLPRGHPPAHRDAPPGPCHRRFPRRPRSRAVAWFPRRLWAPFSAPKHGPGPPGSERTGSPPPASFTHLEALILLRVRSRATQVAPNRPADPLLDFFPSEAFSAHASDPRTRPGLATRTAPQPEGPGDRRRGPHDPPSRWAHPDARVRRDEPLGSIPTPFGAGPDRLSAALLLP